MYFSPMRDFSQVRGWHSPSGPTVNTPAAVDIRPMHYFVQCGGVVECENNTVYSLKRLMYREQLVGAVYLLGNIYLVLEGCCHVLIYSGHSPYDLKDKIFLKGLDALDIATSYADICVYVLDDGNGRVTRIGQDHVVSTVVGGLKRGNLLRMSVTIDGRLVIVKKNSRILIYSKDGKLIGSQPMFAPGGPRMLHALIVAKGNFVVSTETTINKKTTEGRLLCTQKETGCEYISTDKTGNLIGCVSFRHQILRLNSETLEVMDTLLTLDRDGIESPRHVQCVLENGMMLVCWMNCLDVYSFRQSATQGYLAASADDIRMQRTREAELLERKITDNNDALKQLVHLYKRCRVDCIFGDLPPEPQELEPASSLGENAVFAID